MAGAAADVIGYTSARNLPPAPAVRTGLVLRGVASWYGARYHGQLTTNGERFDMFFAHTAAHREVALGTWLLVTHGERELMVRVNDRGPHHRDRMLDLSWAGAMMLGIDTIAEVTAEICVPGY